MTDFNVMQLNDNSHHSLKKYLLWLVQNSWLW